MTVQCGMRNAGSAANPNWRPQSYTPTDTQCVITSDADGEQVFNVASFVVGAKSCGTTAGCDFDEVCSLDEDVNKRAFKKLEGDQKQFAQDNAACLEPQQKACYSMGHKFPAFDFPTQGCEPWETCCDGICCSGNQACIKRISGVVSAYFGVDDSGDPETTTLRATNEWLFPDGSEPEDIPRICSTRGRMSAGSVVKAVIFPVLLMLALVVGAIMVLKTTGMSPMSVGLPAVAVIFCAIILCLTQYWAAAVLISLNAFIALGAVHKGGDFALYCLIPQAVILAIVCGGFGLGNLFVAGQDSLLFDVGRTNGGCAGYFNYFYYEAANRPFKVDSAIGTKGLCSEGFLTTAVIAAAVSIMFQVLMLVASGVEAISGSKM